MLEEINSDEPLTITLGQAQLDQLRALRLYHWLKAMGWRKTAKRMRVGVFKNERNAVMMDHLADQHIRHVQALNDFFPMDDTAERDASR